MIRKMKDIDKIIRFIETNEFDTIKYMVCDEKGNKVTKICRIDESKRYFIVYEECSRFTSSKKGLQKYLWNDRKWINKTERIIYKLSK